MVYKRYYSPFENKNNVPYLNSQQPQSPKIQEFREEVIEKETSKHDHHNVSPLKFLEKIGIDDLIIIGIIIILLMEDRDNRDIPLILALGFLFLIQYIEAE